MKKQKEKAGPKGPKGWAKKEILKILLNYPEGIEEPQLRYDISEYLSIKDPKGIKRHLNELRKEGLLKKIEQPGKVNIWTPVNDTTGYKRIAGTLLKSENLDDHLFLIESKYNYHNRLLNLNDLIKNLNMGAIDFSVLDDYIISCDVFPWQTLDECIRNANEEIKYTGIIFMSMNSPTFIEFLINGRIDQKTLDICGYQEFYTNYLLLDNKPKLRLLISLMTFTSLCLQVDALKYPQVRDITIEIYKNLRQSFHK